MSPSKAAPPLPQLPPSVPPPPIPGSQPVGQKPGQKAQTNLSWLNTSTGKVQGAPSGNSGGKQLVGQ